MNLPATPLSPSRLNEIFSQSQPSPLTIIFPHEESQLKTYLQQYCDGEFDGVTILVSGDRGVGKTTFVYRCIESVMNQVLHGPTGKTSLDDTRLVVPVILSATELFLPAAPSAKLSIKEQLEFCSAQQSPEGSAQQTFGTQHLRLAWMERLTQALVLYVYRYHGHYWQQFLRGRDTAIQVEDQVSYEHLLTSFPYLPDLRDSYERATSKGKRLSTPSDFRKLLALDSLIALARSISGQDKAKKNLNEDSQKSRDKELSEVKQTDVVTIYKSALSLASGAIAYFGTKDQLSLAAIPLAILVTIGAYALQFIASFLESRQSTTLELGFEPDLTVSSLVRRLPGIVSRLRRANIFPVFILDESNQDLNTEYKRLEDFGKWFKSFFTDECMLIVISSGDYYRTVKAVTRVDLRNYYSSEIYLARDPNAAFQVLGDMQP